MSPVFLPSLFGMVSPFDTIYRPRASDQMSEEHGYGPPDFSLEPFLTLTTGASNGQELEMACGWSWERFRYIQGMC